MSVSSDQLVVSVKTFAAGMLVLDYATRGNRLQGVRASTLSVLRVSASALRRPRLLYVL